MKLKLKKLFKDDKVFVQKQMIQFEMNLLTL